MSTDLDDYVKTLTSFANDHLTGDDDHDSLIRIKLDHSMRVLGNAESIIAKESISCQQAKLARLAALFHDIGRFPQLVKYNTLNDRESTNHGRLGVQTLRSISFPEQEVSEKAWRIVRIAVGQHNLKTVSPTLPEPYATPTHIVRDADKMDIFRVMIDNFSGKTSDPIITHGAADVPDAYTDAIYNAVMAQERNDYSNIRYVNDFKLLLLGWVYDLHCASSLEIINERKYIESIFSFLPKDQKIKALEKNMHTFMRYNKS